MNNKINIPGLFASKNDKKIIARMRKLKIWPEVQEKSIIGQTAIWLLPGELFLWRGVANDSGYLYFRSSDQSRLEHIYQATIIYATEINKITLH